MRRKDGERSGTLAKVGSAATPQTAVRIIADQKKQEIEEPLPPRAFRIA